MGARFVAVTAGPSAGCACVAWCRRGARTSVGSARARRACVRRDMAALTEGGDGKATRWTRVAPPSSFSPRRSGTQPLRSRPAHPPLILHFLTARPDGGSCARERVWIRSYRCVEISLFGTRHYQAPSRIQHSLDSTHSQQLALSLSLLLVAPRLLLCSTGPLSPCPMRDTSTRSHASYWIWSRSYRRPGCVLIWTVPCQASSMRESCRGLLHSTAGTWFSPALAVDS
jgi:hypothetical protein